MIVNLNNSKSLFSLNKKSTRRFQKGLSLIESSMVLVLSAIVVAGVMTYYESAEENNKLNDTTNMVMHIMSEVSGMYANQPRNATGINYTKFDTPTLSTYVRDLKLDAKNNIKAPFPGSSMQVGAVDISQTPYKIDPTATDAHGFGIQLTAVPLTLCQKINGMEFGNQLIEIDTQATDNGADIANAKMAIKPTDDMATVISSCSTLMDEVNKTNAPDPKLSVLMVLK